MATLSVTEASRAGLSALVSTAEAGSSTALTRHGKVVAEVVSANEIAQLRNDRLILRDAALVMARFAVGGGEVTTLDDAMEFFDLDRAELEAENANELNP